MNHLDEPASFAFVQGSATASGVELLPAAAPRDTIWLRISLPLENVVDRSDLDLRLNGVQTEKTAYPAAPLKKGRCVMASREKNVAVVPMDGKAVLLRSLPAFDLMEK